MSCKKECFCTKGGTVVSRQKHSSTGGNVSTEANTAIREVISVREVMPVKKRNSTKGGYVTQAVQHKGR